MAKLQGDIIESISLGLGGDALITGETTVVVNLFPNTTASERSQELLLTNFSTKETTRLKITQQTTSVSTKITLNPEIKFQKVTGFGGMLNPSWAGNNLRDAEVQKLYGDLGYNIIRMMLSPNQSDWGLNTATAKKAQSLGAIVFASPWTPPEEMKSNGLQTNKDGAYLLPEKYADYAAHLKAFVDYQKNQGLNIYAVSIQNEPDWKVDYDGCFWSVAQMLNFIQNYGDKLGTKVIVGEAVNNFNKTYTNALLNDAIAVNKFDIAATHLYGGGIADDPLTRQKGKEFWMTEHLFNETNKTATTPEINWTWNPSLELVAKEIHDCMSANFNAYVWWYLKRYYSMIADSDSKNLVAEGEVTKRGYIMGHYAKYATGRTRIKTTVQNVQQPGTELLTTAYQGSNEYTLVIINRNSTNLRVEFAVPSVISSASAVETTEAKNMGSIDTKISDDKKAVTTGISPNSIVSVSIKY
ncbi:MAG: glycoside hydrolase [Paludibacteraceae bacterium]